MNIEVSKLLELETAFMDFSFRTYPKNIEFANLILESCIMILNNKPIGNNDKVSQ